MTLDEVLRIKTLTAEEKEAAKRYYSMPTNKEKPLEGKAEEIKAKLAKNVLNYEKAQARKEKNGTLKEVTARIKQIVSGGTFTYKQILDAIEGAFQSAAEEQTAIEQMEAELKTKKAALKAKKIQVTFE